MKTFLLKIWGHYVRLTARWPSIASLAPFVPVVAAWWIVTELQIFPRVFLPGPVEVVRSFGSLVYTGILPEYLQHGGRPAAPSHPATDPVHAG
jgi:NitT/TauT family transport system permease protein/taurine transport system permease protein